MSSNESEEELAPIDEISTPIKIHGRISHVQRLCRSESMQEPVDITPCPMALKGVKCQFQLERPLSSNSSLLRQKLSSLSYWNRCSCSSHHPPVITEEELKLLLALSPPHRFNIIFISNPRKSSIVTGTESLLTAVYRSLQLPQLRPCLQRPSEPSLAILKLEAELTINLKQKKKKTVFTKRKPKLSELKLGTVLIFQQERLLYLGRPLEDYGCTCLDFLKFVSAKTQHDFSKSISATFKEDL